MNKVSIRCDPIKRKKGIMRMEAYNRREYIDRVPASFGVEARYLLDKRNVGFIEYFETPESNFHNQIMNFKWRMENVEDDFLARKQIDVFPDFQNTTTAGLFNESAIHWLDDEPPRVTPFINTVEELRKLTVPDMNSGMAGRKKRYIRRMQELVREYSVELNGEPFPIVVNMGWHETMLTGALDMLGENFFIWMFEYPEDIKNFMDMMTSTCIIFECSLRAVTGESKQGAGSVSDGAEMMSAEMFNEFAVPYYNRFFDAFPGGCRSMHNCGNIAHLLPILKDKLRLTLLNGFGFSLDPHKLAETVGGAFFYSGGLNPVTLFNGTEDDVMAEVKKYVEILGPYRTFMIGDGYNIVPGTPVERINSIVGFLDRLGIPGEEECIK